MTTSTVGIFVFDGVEVLDFAGPYEVFTTATRVARMNAPQKDPAFRTVLIGADSIQVHARAGLKIEPDCSISNHPELDCLIIPGGVIDSVMLQKSVIDWIRHHIDEEKLVASVCTGSFLLAQTGRLSGLNVTTHWEDIPLLKSSFPDINVLDECRWVDRGNIVSSAGISAGIDMCLHLIERVHSRELALKTARQMDFMWVENRPS